MQRFVLTSSTEAVDDGSHKVEDRVIKECDWSNETKTDNPYSKVKIIYENLVWDFWKALPENDRFELVVLCPGNVMGPVYNKDVDTSTSMIKSILKMSQSTSLNHGYPKMYT